MKLQIDVVDILPKLKKEFEEMARSIVSELFEKLMVGYLKKQELPRYMNKKQACKYMNTSFNTLTKKYIPSGLKVIIIENEEKIDQRDADAFYEKFKK